MRDLRFFDANCAVGAPMNSGVHFAKDVAELLAEMDGMGVERALVRYNIIENGAAYANDRIASLLEDDADGRLLGVWHILPEQCEELPPVDEFFGMMKAKRIAAIRHLAGPQRWVPCRLTIGRTMDAARELRVPLLTTPLAYNDGWAGLYRFVQEFPDNIYIVSGDGLWGVDRDIRPLLENFRGVHFEISSFWPPEGVRDLARKYGADRILYGSGFPQYNHGSMMAVVRHLELDDADKRLIAAGNLERLVSEERP